MPTYLIHFDENFKHARHYSGYTLDLEKRLNEHRAGRGAKLLKAVNGAGIGWRVVRVWLDGRGREKFIKRCKNNPRFCPVCNPK